MTPGLLESGLEQLGVSFNGSHISGIQRYVAEIELWNRRINLVKASGDQIIIRHVLDCAAGVPAFREIGPNTVLDAGSGAGFPGIILSIFNPDVSFTLLDKSAKRTAFLRNCTALLGLQNCEVSEGELASLNGSFDLVCSRAFRPLPAVFEDLACRVNRGGTMMFYKGRANAVRKEIEELGRRTVGYDWRLVEITVPHLQEERHLLLMRDTSQ